MCRHSLASHIVRDDKILVTICVRRHNISFRHVRLCALGCWITALRCAVDRKTHWMCLTVRSKTTVLPHFSNYCQLSAQTVQNPSVNKGAFTSTVNLAQVLTCAAGNWSESSYGSSGIHCLCSKHQRIYSGKIKTLYNILSSVKNNVMWRLPNIKKLLTHSKERIQQPRAMPNRILRVRLGPPDTTWVVLSHTRSTIENPPSVFTTCITVLCFL